MPCIAVTDQPSASTSFGEPVDQIAECLHARLRTDVFGCAGEVVHDSAVATVHPSGVDRFSAPVPAFDRGRGFMARDYPAHVCSRRGLGNVWMGDAPHRSPLGGKR